MTDKVRGKHFNDIYKEIPPEEIPWNSEQPPELLVELIDNGQVKTGRALDLGCGLGNYAIWLAEKGFDVVGVDASPAAIKNARRNARKRKLTAEHAENAEKKIIKNNLGGLCGEYKGKCKFLVADLTGDWPELGDPFDFVYDWGFLHHILPEQRCKCAENVHRVLKSGGRYLSMCFNEKDTAFEGTGKYRKTSLGTEVYLSSEKELRELFGRFFNILDFRVLEVSGKFMTHIFNYCFMKRIEC